MYHCDAHTIVVRLLTAFSLYLWEEEGYALSKETCMRLARDSLGDLGLDLELDRAHVLLQRNDFAFSD